jgi:tetraacyldisaccharide 4'-kinase
MTPVKAFFADLQSGRDRSVVAIAVSYLLYPMSLIYALMLLIRRASYTFGVCKIRGLPGRVICVGNITTGGTGKTPVTMLLADWLAAHGAQFAILSRGYRSAYERRGITFNSSSLTDSQAIALGDEVALMARRLPNTWFGIGKNRFQSGVALKEQHDINLFLLDDGFQHIQLKRDCDLVLIDATTPIGNGFLLPAGSLREPLASLRRAHLVLITRAELVSPRALDSLKAILTKCQPADHIFTLRTSLNRVYDLITGEAVAMSALRGKGLFAFSGIGNSASFASLLSAAGLNAVDHRAFDNHHVYSNDDLSLILGQLHSRDCDLLITTEKDAVKLPRDWVRAGECLVAQISLAFEEREDIFWGKIAEVTGC